MFDPDKFWTRRDFKPHLRIYANQNHDDIEKGVDFIAPQVVTTSEWPAASFDLILEKARVYHQNGAIELSITVDASGNLRDVKVILEDLPGFGFGDHARKLYAKAKYIPGFRDGHPVDCTFDYAAYDAASKEYRVKELRHPL